MKVGIFTFHYAHNYGAVLQAYALKTYLQKCGHIVEIINYRNKKISSNYKRKLHVTCNLRDIIHLKRLYGHIKFFLNLKYAQIEWNEQYNKFEAFIQKYLSKDREITYSDLLDYVEKYDILFTGSDQVWASNLTGGLDKVYLLDFPFSGRKASYAASNGNCYIKESERNLMKKSLSNFYAISTRESKLSDTIMNDLNLFSQCVVDPTLLLKKEDYSIFLDKNKKTKEKFVFVYYVAEDRTMSLFSKKVADQLGYKLIELHYFSKKDFDKETQFANFGPEDFIQAINDSSLIITNSFHGTALSIIFQKNFYSYYLHNDRIENLLNKISLENRHVGPGFSVEIENISIDYNVTNRELSNYRKSSKDYIAKIFEDY